MKYVIIPVSFLLGFFGMWIDVALFRGEANFFEIVCFLLPSIFCLGMLYDETFNKD